MFRSVDTAAPLIASSSGLEDAPTTLFDDDEAGEVAAARGTDETDPPTADRRSDPWADVGVDLGNETLSQYRLLEVVAHGGAVDAYLAEHAFLGRRVLVKLIAAPSRDHDRGFLAEATALWQLSHPSFPAVLEYGTDVKGRPYVIMEYSAGTSLSQRLVGGPVPAALALDLAEQALTAMATAHGRGVAHGALSTDAIYLCAESALRHGVRVKIADFAAAVPAEAHASTRVEVERAIRAAQPEDDLVAAAGVLRRLLAAIQPSMPPRLGEGVVALADRLRTGQTTMAEAAGELRRIALDLELFEQATGTGLIAPTGGSWWWGGAIIGGVVLVATLGAIL